MRKAVAAGAVEVDLDGVPGLVLPDDLDPVPAPEPWVALLLALDPTPWAGPAATSPACTAWCCSTATATPGRLSGGRPPSAAGPSAAAARSSRASSRTSADATGAIEAEAARLTTWLGPVRSPPVPHPLERELVAEPAG